MNVGRYVFAQVMDFLPQYEFKKIVKKYNADFHAKNLNSYNQLQHLLFGQLTGYTSLHKIIICLTAHYDIIYHLGIRNTIRVSLLARANKTRNNHLFKELGQYLIHSVLPLYAKESIQDISVDKVIYTLDPTTISISIKLATWALGIQKEMFTKG